jgi:hypothetical protein
MKKILVALAILPLAAFAQGPGPGAGMGPGRGMGPGAGPGPGRGDPERMEKRMRLARTLGLAEALDLDQAHALKLGDSVSKFDERRLAAHKQLRDAHDVLRRAATGEKVAAGDVDQAIQRALDARAQIQVVDREVIAAVTKDLSPDKKARAVLFLEKFQNRFGPGGPRGARDGMGNRMGRGMGRGMGMGPRAGMGPGSGWAGSSGTLDEGDDE